jgi:hypothetical protein
MELVLKRYYAKAGTNGTLFLNEKLLCYTIELPWKDNMQGKSCIPEGRYELKRRFSQKFGQHLLIQDVPGRKLILIHPANHAKRELKGCIAPVSYLNSPGRGSLSRFAMSKLLAIANASYSRNETLFLNIQSSTDENNCQKG